MPRPRKPQFTRRESGLLQGSYRVTGADGRTVRRYLYGRDAEELARRLRAAQVDADRGRAPPVGRQTLGVFGKDWLETNKRRLAPSSWRRYEQLWRVHIEPALGRVALRSLTAQQISRFYAERTDAVAARTVRHMHELLHAMLEEAVNFDLVLQNVSGKARRPEVTPQQAAPLEPEQVQRLLDATRETPLGPLLTLAATTGMRQGELFGLRWQDVNRPRGELTVRSSLSRALDGRRILKDTKTGKQRTLYLAGPALAALDREREEVAALRMRAGPLWVENDLVFPNGHGEGRETNNFLRREWYPLLKRLGLPRVVFHSLRHSAISYLLSLGIPAAVVARYVGHASTAMTLGPYNHPTPGEQAAIVTAMGRLSESHENGSEAQECG